MAEWTISWFSVKRLARSKTTLIDMTHSEPNEHSLRSTRHLLHPQECLGVRMCACVCLCVHTLTSPIWTCVSSTDCEYDWMIVFMWRMWFSSMSWNLCNAWRGRFTARWCNKSKTKKGTVHPKIKHIFDLVPVEICIGLDWFSGVV